MLEEFEYIGEWWFPDKSEEKFSGTLKIIPDKRPILKMMDVSESRSSRIIENFGNIISGSSPDPEIILGRCYGGKDIKDITLYKCFQTDFHMDLVQYGSVRYFSPAVVFIGGHFNKPEDIKFKDLFIHYSHLGEWLKKSRLKDISRIFECPNETATIIKVPLSKDCLVVIENALGISGKHSIEQKEINIKEKSFVKINAEAEKSFLEEYQKIERCVRTFLSLWVSKPIYPLSIQGISSNLTVEIYSPQTILAESIFPRHKELCSFNDISTTFGVYLRKWFEQAEELVSVYNLYFRILYNPLINFEYIFQDLAFAVEAYHRIRYEGEYQPRDEYIGGLYKCFIASIPSSIDSDFKQSLKERLKYLNEYSLRKRLTQLMQKYKDVIPFPSAPDKDKFIEDVTNTRNYLAHRDDSLRSKAKTGKELYDICVILKILLEVCFLDELGMPEENIKNLVLKNRILRPFGLEALKSLP